jgi:uncharacterized membrane protein
MPLLRALNTIPLWTLILGLLAVFELYSVGLMLLARRRLGFDRLKLNNEVAGFKFSVIGVLYAVLLAFVVIAVWENYHATETAIRNEAKAAGDMAQLSYALPETQGEEMRRVARCLREGSAAIGMGTMAQGLPSKAAADALAHLTQATINMQVGQMRDLAVFQQALHLLAVIEDNRNERLDSADGSVPDFMASAYRRCGDDLRLSRILWNHECSGSNSHDRDPCCTCCSYLSASNPARFPVHWRGCVVVSAIR